jgi:negative regulator of sigma E activity
MRRALAGKIWQEWHLIHNILKGEYPWIACNDFGGSVYYLSEPLLQRINVVKG